LCGCRCRRGGVIGVLGFLLDLHATARLFLRLQALAVGRRELLAIGVEDAAGTRRRLRIDVLLR